MILEFSKQANKPIILPLPSHFSQYAVREKCVRNLSNVKGYVFIYSQIRLLKLRPFGFYVVNYCNNYTIGYSNIRSSAYSIQVICPRQYQTFNFVLVTYFQSICLLDFIYNLEQVRDYMIDRNIKKLRIKTQAEMT